MKKKSTKVWIFAYGFGFILIFMSFKGIVLGGIMAWAIFYTYAMIPEIGILTKEVLLPVCYALCSLVLLFGGIGLLRVKNWARTLVLSVYPIWLLLALVFHYMGGTDVLSFLYKDFLIPPVFYVVLIYFFTRPEVKEEFRTWDKSTEWDAWGLFQSRIEKEIYEHMTESEERKSKWLSGIFGLWIALTLGIPIYFAIEIKSTLLISIAILLVIIHIFGDIIWRKKLKKFLCSTEWAKSQGYKPEDIRFYRFGRNTREHP